MLGGKRFELRTATLAVDIRDGKRVAVTIPAGAIFKVISDPRHGESMVDVLWEGRTYVMFAIDVTERGIDITDRNSKA